MASLNKTKNTILGTFWGVGSKLLSLIFPFIIRMIIIREMGAEYTGLGGLFNSILTVLSLAELGIGTSLVYSMYEPVAKDDVRSLSAHLNFYRKAYIIIGTIITSFGICVIPFLKFLIKGSSPNTINIYILYCIYLFNTVSSYFFFAYRSSILSAYQQDAVSSKIQLITNVTMYISQIIILIFMKNYYLYAVMLPLATIMLNYIKYRYVCKKYSYIKCEGTISKNERKLIKSNIIALFCHKIGGTVVNTADTIVISMFLGLVTLSNYDNYYYLINSITMMVIIFFSSLTAGLGNSMILDDHKTIKRNFYTILYINGFLVSVCTVCFFNIFQDCITLWVGKEYLFSKYIMYLFCYYFFIHVIRRTIITSRDAAGAWSDNKWQPIVSATINLTLNIATVKIIGIYGILLSTIISMMFIDIPWETKTFFENQLKDNRTTYYLRIIYYLMITVLSCVLCSLILRLVNLNNLIITIIVEGIVSVVVTVTLFVTLTKKLDEYKFARDKVYSVIKNKF